MTNSLILAIDGTRMLTGARQAQQAGRIIGEEIKDATFKVRENKEAVDQNGKALEKLANQIKQLVGAYLGFRVIKSATDSLANFEQAVANIGAASSATNDELKIVSEELKNISQTSKYSIDQIEASLLSIVRAGFSLQDAIGILPNALSLAAASFGEVSVAADVTGDVLKSFNLQVTESARVADVLSNLANITAADITEIKDAIATVAPVAAQFGVSLEEVAAGIATLTERGLRARIGALGLKEVLIQLGPALDKANPERVGLTEALEKLADEQFTASEQTAIFSKEVVQVSTTLLNNVTRYKELVEAAGQAGEAQKIVAQQNETLRFSLDKTASAAEYLWYTIGEQGYSKALREVLKLTSDAILILAGQDRAQREASDTAHTLAIALSAAFDVGIAVSAGAITAAIAAMAVSVTSALGPLGTLVAVLATVGVALKNVYSDIGDVNSEFRRLQTTTQDFRLIPKTIDSDLNKLSRTAAVLRLAQKAAEDSTRANALNDRVKSLRDFERELEILGAQGGYTSTSINELARALDVDPQSIRDLEIVNNLIKQRGVDVASTTSATFSATKTLQAYEEAGKGTADAFAKWYNLSKEALAGTAEITQEGIDNLEAFKKAAQNLRLDKYDFKVQIDENKLRSAKIIQNDVILKLIKDEILKVQTEIDSNPAYQINPIGKTDPNKVATDISRTIDEVIGKLRQRAKNAGNIDVFAEIIRKLKEETEELRGNNVERAQSKAIIEAQNFAKQQGYILTEDNIRIIKEEVAVQQKLNDAIKAEAEAKRIAKEKRDEAEEVIRSLQDEYDLMFLSNRERERQVAHRQADRIAAKSQTAEVKALVQELKAEADKVAKLKSFKEIADAFTDPLIDGIEQVIFRFHDLADIARYTALDISRELLRAAVLNPLRQSFSKFFTDLIGVTVGASTGGGAGAETFVPQKRNALGDAFAGGYGQLISSPVLLGGSSQRNLFGEAGEEVAFPVTRDRQGRVAVRAEGGGSTIINANLTVNANNPSDFGRSRRQVMDTLRSVARGVAR